MLPNNLNVNKDRPSELSRTVEKLGKNQNSIQFIDSNNSIGNADLYKAYMKKCIIILKLGNVVVYGFVPESSLGFVKDFPQLYSQAVKNVPSLHNNLIIRCGRYNPSITERLPTTDAVLKLKSSGMPSTHIRRTLIFSPAEKRNCFEQHLFICS